MADFDIEEYLEQQGSKGKDPRLVFAHIMRNPFIIIVPSFRTYLIVYTRIVYENMLVYAF